MRAAVCAASVTSETTPSRSDRALATLNDHLIHREGVAFVLACEHDLKFVEAFDCRERFEQNSRVDQHTFDLHQILGSHDRRHDTVAAAPAMRARLMGEADDIADKDSERDMFPAG